MNDLRLDPQQMLGEVSWLLECGEDTDRIASRLHTTPSAIVKAARDAGRPGLAAKVQKGWRRLS